MFSGWVGHEVEVSCFCDDGGIDADFEEVAAAGAVSGGDFSGDAEVVGEEDEVGLSILIEEGDGSLGDPATPDFF